ncbi:MAG: peptidase [Gammaproteobacteria bacterium]|jgi:Zn-dependent M28 family amino/carboxypeptidase|nr:peptidase [Gammaproteobacteria bacterium]
MLKIPGHTFTGTLPPLNPNQLEIIGHLQQYIQHLAGGLGERNLWHYENLQAAANYIRRLFIAQGYQPENQQYMIDNKLVQNIAVELSGSSLADEIIIVGAHYDSILGSPGANDNGSGMAVLLELSRLLAQKKLLRTVRFVAFTNKELPFFGTLDMGSYVYASRAKARDEHIIAMLSLDTLGYYSDDKESQAYPVPALNYWYPTVANFIAFVGNIGSYPLIKKVMGAFRHYAQFPSEGLAAPTWIKGIGSSDQVSFWQHDYPGIMITDTASFRYPYYHTANDTPDKIDYCRTARVADGLARAVADLAGYATS